MQSQSADENATRVKTGKTRKIWPGLIIAFLSLAVLLQLTLLGRDTFREMPRLIADLGQPAIWRSARYSQGRRFAQYIQFLNQKIPPQYRVILPPDNAAPRVLTTTPMMQFFLLPRQVINCTSPDCLEPLSLQDTAVLVTSGFPRPENLAGGMLERFDADWGVLLPVGSVLENTPPPPGYNSISEIVRDALLAAAWLALLTLAGFVFVQQGLPPAWGTARLALGYGLGLVLLTFSLALVSLLGVPLRRETVLTIIALLLAAAAAIWLLKWRRSPLRDRFQHGRKMVWKAFLPDPWQVVFVILALLAAFYSTVEGYHATDELVLWGAKGYGIAADGSILSITRWGTNTVAYPLHVPLAIAASNLLFGETLPAAKLLFPGYVLALALLLYQTLNLLGLRRSLSGTATLAAVTAPLVFRHGTLAYANLPLSFYLFAAVVLLAFNLLGTDRPSVSATMLLSGVMFSAAAWTRPEGLVFSWLMIGVILLVVFLARGVKIRWSRLGLLVTPLLVYSAFWLWLKATVYALPLGRDDLAATAVGQLLSGKLHLPEALYIGRALLAGLFDLQSWGLLGMLVLLVTLTSLFVLAARRRKPSNNMVQLSAALAMALSGGFYLLAIAGIYYLTSYDTVHDISWWVSTGLDRMLMPGMLLLWAGSITTINPFIPDDATSKRSA